MTIFEPPWSGSSDSDSVRRLSALLVASDENIAPSSFDHLVSLTAKVMQCSKAIVMLNPPADPEDGDVALLPASLEIDSALVRFAIDEDEAFVISDLTADARFVNDPLVISGPQIGYFACAPLIDSFGRRVGTLCAADATPRQWLRSNELDAMDALAGAIVADMALDESRLEVMQRNLELSRLHEVQEMKDEFVAMVSHELRTPLTSIAASLGLLEDGILGDLPGEVREVVGVASANTTRLISLVDDLLDLERMESGVIALTVAPASISELIEESVNAVSASAANVGIELQREDRFDPGAKIECDASRIVQVLVNLLGNAIKFADSGTTVTIRTESFGQDRIVFSVVDWGKGIAKESIAKLFDPFWQVDSSTSRRSGGSGLGLAISKKIVDQHSGQIDVESTLGIGSTFRVELPLRFFRQPG